MTYSREELKARVKRMFADPYRGISRELFAELCGVSDWTLRRVFFDEDVPLSEMVQIRVSKALEAWERGEVAVMERRDRSRYVEYRKVAKPRLKRHMGLAFKDGKIGLDIGIRNRADYSRPTFEEKLKGK